MLSHYGHQQSMNMYPKNHSGGSGLPYGGSPSAAAWYINYHHQPPSGAQFLGDPDAPHQPVYYPHHMFQQSSPDWAGHENYSAPPQSSTPASLLQGVQGSGVTTGSVGGPSGFLSINQATQNGNSNNNNEHIHDGLQSLPSPPITVSGSDMSSPGAPNGSSSPHIHSRPTPVKSPYEWMKKPSYQSQPNPGIINICSAPSLEDFSMEINGKTRTKDKYRVVYSDHQRLELEKEFHYTRYITIRRKSELAQNLSLSERQVKIWFQNRRAKDRKQKKKIDSGSSISQSQNSINTSSSMTTANLSNFLDMKPKIDPSTMQLHHFQQMTAMGLRIR
ncbi:CLUMA_CG000149, isoform A [Clunio marinus]|uniref:CLUMA_CG000149, isoform A n=1 Tax=Clunio marinus TaxID=568069 RepID=A0A1J1HJR0_9DIPT|nr:CLUMA_CG000149, isoform A [Clunio marinus]